MRLTEKDLEEARPKAAAYRLYDSGAAAFDQAAVRGSGADALYLEVAPNGTKSWKIEYHQRGRKGRLTPGTWPRLSLKQAREAQNKVREALKKGEDPVEALEDFTLRVRPARADFTEAAPSAAVLPPSNPPARTENLNRRFFGIIEKGKPENLRAFLQEHPEAVSWKNEDAMGFGRTGLMEAAASGREDAAGIMTVLTGFHADLDARGRFGNTALILAAWHGHDKAFDFLLKAGADLTPRDNTQKSALDYTEEKGRPDLAAKIRAEAARRRLQTLRAGIRETRAARPVSFRKRGT